MQFMIDAISMTPRSAYLLVYLSHEHLKRLDSEHLPLTSVLFLCEKEWCINDHLLELERRFIVLSMNLSKET
jgi:hypothetical protein